MGGDEILPHRPWIGPAGENGLWAGNRLTVWKRMDLCVVNCAQVVKWCVTECDSSRSRSTQMNTGHAVRRQPGEFSSSNPIISPLTTKEWAGTGHRPTTDQQHPRTVSESVTDASTLHDRSSTHTTTPLVTTRLPPAHHHAIAGQTTNAEGARERSGENHGAREHGHGYRDR
jgi:hypothetical protein